MREMNLLSGTSGTLDRQCKWLLTFMCLPSGLLLIIIMNMQSLKPEIKIHTLNWLTGYLFESQIGEKTRSTEWQEMDNRKLPRILLTQNSKPRAVTRMAVNKELKLGG